MNYRLNHNSAADIDERRLEDVAVKKIVEMEAVWRINAASDAVLLPDPDEPAQTWKLAA